MRNMSPQHILDYAQRVAKYLDSSDIMCDWPCMDLRVLGQRIEDAKRTVPGQVMEEVVTLFKSLLSMCVHLYHPLYF